MRFVRLTRTGVMFVVFAAVVEAAWLASLALLLDRFGAMALGGALVAALGVMVAVLDAAPVGDPTDRLNLP